MTDEQKAEVMTVSRTATIQVSSEGTDDVIVAASANEKLRHAAFFALSKPDFVFGGQRQIRDFVNSCLLNMSNHHNVDTTRILTDLAAFNGSQRLKEILTRPMNVDTGDHKSILSFQYVILPLIGVLTRESLCQSTLATETGAIYANVYQYRKEFLENGVMVCMGTLLTRGSMQDNSVAGRNLARDPEICHVDSMPRALLAITRLFYQFIKRFQDSRVTMVDLVGRLYQLQISCQSMSSNSDEDRFLNVVLAREVMRLQRIVSDAQESLIQPVDPRESQRTSQSSKGANMVHLTRFYDPPGTLSEEGPRHDNDHPEIKDIKVLPTQEEITASRPPFLPSNGILDAPHFLPLGWKRQLDTHFRLYREDMLESIRKGVMSFLHALQTVDRADEQILLRQGGLKKFLQDGVNLNVYGNVQFLGIDCSKEQGGSIAIAFGQPSRIEGKPKKDRTEFWERSRRRLMQGALVCIARRSRATQHNPELGLAATPPFEMAFGVVTRRDVEVLAKDGNFAQIHITLTDLKVYLTMLTSQNQSTDEWTDREQWFLVESSGGFFESYRPILVALQNCVPATLPFGKYIAPTEEENDAMLNGGIVDPPMYARAPRFSYDLSVLLKGQNLRLDATNPASVRDAIDVLQRRSKMNLPNEKPLDMTQASALIDTLCREVALISG